MKIENINYKRQVFTLVRTSNEVKKVAKEIGISSNNNIALYVHFVETKRKRHVIDFEMINYILDGISYYNNCPTLSLLASKLTNIKKDEKQERR